MTSPRWAVKVLIAEDDPISRRLLQGHLERWGHEVTAAVSGGEAWRRFEHESYPLVITDWMMPEIDGPELVRRIRGCQRPGYVYIILLTARSQKEDVVHGMEAGADDFVCKPFDREELRVRLRAGERIIQLEHSLAEQNRALRDAQAALVQNEKLASLGRLAAGVAHEINNPLAYVTNNFVVLRRDMQASLDALDAYRQGHGADAARLEQEADVPYFQENFGRTCAASLEGLERVRDIVKNLREFARLDEAETKEIDLNTAFESAVEILRHEFKKKDIRVETRLEPLPPVLCYPGKINQVFLNLLLNAAEACNPGGMVTGRSWSEPGKGVVIEIQDDGSGIRPEHRPRLFEPFFTTKPVGQGMGLGLFVSFAIVRDHGGAIEVESESSRGSTFRVRLPLTGINHGSCQAPNPAGR
jgi:two-component system NtrC family sensor kinase